MSKLSPGKLAALQTAGILFYAVVVIVLHVIAWPDLKSTNQNPGWAAFTLCMVFYWPILCTGAYVILWRAPKALYEWLRDRAEDKSGEALRKSEAAMEALRREIARAVNTGTFRVEPTLTDKREKRVFHV